MSQDSSATEGGEPAADDAPPANKTSCIAKAADRRLTCVCSGGGVTFRDGYQQLFLHLGRVHGL